MRDPFSYTFNGSLLNLINQTFNVKYGQAIGLTKKVETTLRQRSKLMLI